MKQKISIFGAVLISVFLVAPVTYAVTSNSDEQATTSSVADRVKERQTKVSEKLSAAQSTRIQNRCLSAQTNVGKVGTAVTSYNDAVVTRYDTLIKKLNEIMQQRATTGKNSSELNSSTAALTQKYQSYKTAYETVKTDISDLTSLDCKADPAGFSATLKQSRTNLEAMRSARADLNAYTKDTIVKNLQTIKKES